MPFNPSPGAMFVGYQSLANGEAAPAPGLFIPLTALATLSAAEADETTGDSREILRSIVVRAADYINALPPADKPTKLTITQPNPTALAGNGLRQAINLSFDTIYQTAALGIAPEV